MNFQGRKAWLFTATSPAEIFGGYAAIDADQGLVIAVDAGLHRVRELGLNPILIIGDMDSVEPGLADLYPDCEQIRHPRQKNETDTELALNWCLEAGGVGEIVICNGLEGRFDHSLALVHNLESIRDRGVTARIESEKQRLWFLEAETSLSGHTGCLLSLFAWGEESVFQRSHGLQYPLDGLKLHPGQVRGISNRIEGVEASIKLDRGKILAILTKYV